MGKKIPLFFHTKNLIVADTKGNANKCHSSSLPFTPYKMQHIGQDTSQPTVSAVLLTTSLREKNI